MPESCCFHHQSVSQPIQVIGSTKRPLDTGTSHIRADRSVRRRFSQRITTTQTTQMSKPAISRHRGSARLGRRGSAPLRRHGSTTCPLPPRPQGKTDIMSFFYITGVTSALDVRRDSSRSVLLPPRIPQPGSSDPAYSLDSIIKSLTVIDNGSDDSPT